MKTFLKTGVYIYIYIINNNNHDNNNNSNKWNGVWDNKCALSVIKGGKSSQSDGICLLDSQEIKVFSKKKRTGIRKHPEVQEADEIRHEIIKDNI